MKLKKKLIVFVLIFQVSSFLVKAQQKINGLVYNQNNREPLSGITVRLQRAGITSVTDKQGHFSLLSRYGQDTLIFTSIGYQLQKVRVEANVKSTLNIAMIQLEGALEEVVVNTGFYSVPKERATGSFTHIDNKLLNRSVGSDLLSRLEGVTNGLQFNRNNITGENKSGDKPELRVRGLSTIEANSYPLIVIDNFPYDGDLNTINPNDIESVTILKDAAAASIWGAQAANGVIVITTKQGKYNQKAQIRWNSNISIAEKPDLFYNQNFLPSETVMQIEKELFDRNAYKTEPQTFIPAYAELLIKQKEGTINEIDFKHQESLMKQTDIRKEALDHLYQHAVNQQYALSVNGGETKYRYYLSAGYDKNIAGSIGNQNNRLNLNLQNTFKPVRNLELTAAIWYVRQHSSNNGLTYEKISNQTNGIIPYTRLADDNRTALPIGITGLRTVYQEQAINSGLLDWMYRPLDEMELADNSSKSNELRLNGGIRFSFLKNFNLNATYQYIASNQADQIYYAPETFYVRDLVNRFTQADGTKIIPYGGILSGSAPVESNSHSGRAQLNYDLNLNHGHQISALAGAEIRQYTSSEFPGYTLYNYNNDLAVGSRTFDYTRSYPIRPLSSAKIPMGSSLPSLLINRYLSYFSNAAYNYKHKYMLSGSLRWDGSNLLGVKTNQKGTALWSVGASWEISKEEFYSLKQLNYLRFRITYGSSGNVDRSQSHFPTIGYVNNSLTGLLSASLISPGNPYLKWEQVNTWNLGLDWAMLNSRIQVSLDAYIKNAKDLLAPNLMDPTIGVSTNYKINYGDMQTKGFDLQLTSRNLQGIFNWQSTLLLNYTQNEITNINAPVQSSIGSYFVSRQPIKGRSLDIVYALPWNGLDPLTGRPVISINGEKSFDYTNYYTNYNKDDLAIAGLSVPPYYGSLRNTFGLNGLELSAVISFKFNYVFRRNSMWTGAEYASTGPEYHQDYFKRWKQPGDEVFTNVPAASQVFNTNERDSYRYSEALISKGDHIRLQDINLSYSLRGKHLQNLGLQSIRIYAYARNLGLIWKANKDGLDPDYAHYGYPDPKIYSLGLQVNF